MAINIPQEMASRPMKDWALLYASIGWRVFPIFEAIEIEPGTWRCCCAEGDACGRPGKHPRVRDGVNEGTTDRVTIEGWWTRWPNANIGVATGRASNLTVVDADCSEGKPGVVNLSALSAKNGGMPSTPTVDTGSGGLHLYFTYAGDALQTGANVLAEAIDVRSDGGYVILPPSRHISGKQYSWRNNGLDVIAAPDWILEARGGRAETPAKAKGRKRTQPGFKLNRLESMLQVLDPDDRDLWLQVGVIMGRLYIGTSLENEGWAVYEAWASRSSKFDEDRAGNVARMREMFYERSQDAPRTGGKPLGVGTIINAAKVAGWSPFGDRVRIQYEPGNEEIICEQLVAALIEKNNTFYNVMGEVRDVLKTERAIVREKAEAHAKGEKAPEMLVVRRATTHGLLCAMAGRAVLETVTKDGAPEAVPIAEKLGTMILKQKAPLFPTLTGIAEWPMVAADGSLIAGARGYDPATGLYFDIDEKIRLNEQLSAEAGAEWLQKELLADFPFEEPEDAAAAMGLLLSMMQRPMMRICPAFAVVAPQPGTGKSTLIEMGSIAVLGRPVKNHPLASEDDELRKAIHSLMMSKEPAVMFDNITRGRTIDSDHLSKLITSEMTTDRTLGASETRSEVNTLLVTFTGNNIAFGHDMGSRVLQIRINAKTANPMGRSFRHKDILRWVATQRSEVLSALVAIMRAGLQAPPLEGKPTRFYEFDEGIARAIYVVTGCDIRTRIDDGNDADSEEDAELRAALELMAKWQNKWRKENNGFPWKTSELVGAIDAKLFDETALKLLQRAVGNQKAWEADPARAISMMLRLLNGDHKFEPLLLTGRMDRHEKVNKWFIKGAEEPAAAAGGF